MTGTDGDFLTSITTDWSLIQKRIYPWDCFQVYTQIEMLIYQEVNLIKATCNKIPVETAKYILLYQNIYKSIINVKKKNNKKKKTARYFHDASWHLLFFFFFFFFCHFLTLISETHVFFSPFLSFFLPILCSANSDHDNRVGVWHISFKTTKKKKEKKKYCDTATSRLKLYT